MITIETYDSINDIKRIVLSKNTNEDDFIKAITDILGEDIVDSYVKFAVTAIIFYDNKMKTKSYYGCIGVNIIEKFKKYLKGANSIQININAFSTTWIVEKYTAVFI